MAVSTKRKNSLKSKSNSKTRKQFKKFRKTKKNVRKMKGGDGDLKIFNGHTDDVMSVVFSPNGKYICSGSVDNTVRLWNVDTGENIRTLKGHTNYVKSVSFCPDGKYICSGSDDKTVRLWEIPPPQYVFPRINSYNHNGTDLVNTYNGAPPEYTT